MMGWRGLLGTCAMLAAPPGIAAAKPMNFSELSACATLAVARAEPSTRGAERSALQARREALLREVAALDAHRAKVDRAMIGEVALFNDRVTRACAEQAALVAALNLLNDAGNASARAYNEACADRDYDPAHVVSLPAGLRVAWNALSADDTPVYSVAALPPRPVALLH